MPGNMLLLLFDVCQNFIFSIKMHALSLFQRFKDADIPQNLPVS